MKGVIPLEYLGGGYGINNVPINQLEHVEIYKGVVPVNLGGDALGGAVNLVTNQNHKKTFQASYEVGSFNTHLINLSGQQQFRNNWFAGIDAFVNYSDNDYKVDIETVDENANLKPARVKLFHNAYKHYFTEAYAGIKNKKWADELRLSIALYQIDRQSQHPALMTNPYGAIKLNNKGIDPGGDGLQVGFGDGDAVFVTQQVLEKHLHRARQTGNPGQTGFLGGGKAVIGVFLAPDREVLAGLEAVNRRHGE